MDVQMEQENSPTLHITSPPTLDGKPKSITSADVSQVVDALDGVRNIRGLALQLGLSQDERDALDTTFNNPKDRKAELVLRWISSIPNRDECNWQRLQEALCAPLLKCMRAAERINVFLSCGNWPHMVKQESGDSAVSVSFSPSSANSLESPSFSFSTQLPTKITNQEFTVLNIANALSEIPNFKWESFGRYFGLEDLVSIREYVIEERTVRVVESVHMRKTSTEFNWEIIQKWLKRTALVEDLQPHEMATKTEVREKVDLLEKKFKVMIKELCKCLEGDTNKVDFFYEDKMYLLPQPLQGLEEHLNCRGLEDGDIQKFFRLNRNIWNFIDYDFIRLLVRRCGTCKLKEEMSNYEREVDQFCQITTPYQLIEVWAPRYANQDIPENFKECVAKMLLDPYRCRLQDLKEIKRKIAEVIPQEIGKVAFVLVEVIISSVTAVWQVLPEILPQLMQRLKKLIQTYPKFIPMHRIALFILDEVILYPCTNDEKFWNASREGAFEVVQKYLAEARATPNQVYEVSGRIALQCAAKHGHLKIASCLIEFGAQIDHQDAKGCTAVILATQARQTNMVEYLIREGASLDIQEKVRGMCPLLIAAEKNDVRICRLCISSHRSDLNIRNKNGKTALILAAERGNCEIVEAIMERDAEIVITEAQDIHGRTALHAAAECGNQEIVKCLISSPGMMIDMLDENQDRAVDVAMKNQHMEVVQLLSHDGCRVQGLEADSGGAEGGVTGEGEGAEGGGIEGWGDDGGGAEGGGTGEGEGAEGGGIEGWGDDGGDSHVVGTSSTTEKSTQDKKGKESKVLRLTKTVFQTVRHGGTLDIRIVRAATKGNHRDVEHLIARGANPNAKGLDTQRWTAMIWAIQKGHLEVVKVLLRHESNPNTAALNGYTPLILASRKGHHEIVKILLDPTNPIEVDIKATNATDVLFQRGWSALMWASQSRGGKHFTSPKEQENRRKVVEHLLAAGADVNQTVYNGWTPLMQASQDGHSKLVEMFCKVESLKIDHQSKSTWSALTTACRKGNEEIVKLLVRAGADVNQKKKGGITSIHIACYKGMTEAVKYIVPTIKEENQRPGVKADVNIQDEWGMTPLMFSIKQEHKTLTKYLVSEARADVNIRAMKFAQWTAVFFAIKNKDEETVDLLVNHNASMEIRDENNHTPISYSKSILLEKQIHKYLVKQRQYQLKQQAQPTVEESQPPPGKVFNPLDLLVYSAREAMWRAQQQINIVFNT